MWNPIQSIGRYRIQRELGSGAMGTVYLALDPLLMRQVAVKVVSEIRGDSAEILARFHREALISAKLNHPHIITIFDVGEDPVLGPFMAMEYIDGATLAHLIQEKLTRENGLSLLIQVMSALLASEKAGVSHRDVKPDNILVGKDWRVKLLDFGIAHSDEARITGTGMFFSTPNYTAPELLLGTEASSQSDRYSFAVTAFEVLSGALPFQGTSVGSLLFSIIHDPPRVPESFNRDLRRVFERALAKNPDYRYPDLLLFMEALLKAVTLTEEEQGYLQMHLAEIRACELQGPLTTDSSPIHQVVSQGRTKINTKARTSSQPETRRSERNGPASIPEGRPWGFTRATLLRGTTLFAVAATTLLLFAGPARSKVARWFAKKRLVDITSSPGSARIYLDGRLLGRTPAYHLEIGGSAHTLRAELPDYITQTWVIQPGETRHFFSLMPRAVFIPVNSDPSGALIFLNDQPMGSTPIEALRIPTEGRQELVMRHSGYREWRAVVDPDLPLADPVRLNPNTSPRRPTAQGPGASGAALRKPGQASRSALVQVERQGNHDLSRARTGSGWRLAILRR